MKAYGNKTCLAGICTKYVSLRTFVFHEGIIYCCSPGFCSKNGNVSLYFSSYIISFAEDLVYCSNKTNTRDASNFTRDVEGNTRESF